jgi:hypothetical protein
MCITNTLAKFRSQFLQRVYEPAFTCANPKSAKRLSSCQCLFALFGSVFVKADCKMFLKSTPGVNFINIFCTLFSYECRFGSFFSTYVHKKSCQNDIPTKKASEKHWWNWLQEWMKPTHWRKMQMWQFTELFPFCFISKTVPNFTSTLNYKLHPTFMLYALRCVPVRSANFYWIKSCL